MKIGWLNATQDDKHKKTRIEQYGEESLVCALPEVDKFLLHTFREIGMASVGGMQLTPLSFSELDAYCNRMRVNLTPWESINIIDMSRHYVGYLSKGTDVNCPSPWNTSDEDLIKENDDRIAEKMKSLRGKNKE